MFGTVRTAVWRWPSSPSYPLHRPCAGVIRCQSDWQWPYLFSFTGRRFALTWNSCLVFRCWTSDTNVTAHLASLLSHLTNNCGVLFYLVRRIYFNSRHGLCVNVILALGTWRSLRNVRDIANYGTFSLPSKMIILLHAICANANCLLRQRTRIWKST